jgi:hypothetical protein
VRKTVARVSDFVKRGTHCPVAHISEYIEKIEMWEISRLLLVLLSSSYFAFEEQQVGDRLVVLEPNKVYASHIGNRTMYQLKNDQPQNQFAIYQVSLTAELDSSAEVLVQVCYRS